MLNQLYMLDVNLYNVIQHLLGPYMSGVFHDQALHHPVRQVLLGQQLKVDFAALLRLASPHLRTFG
jgi:hypothetical protein